MTYYKVQEFKEINLTHNGKTVTYMFVEDELYLARELANLGIDVEQKIARFYNTY